MAYPKLPFKATSPTNHPRLYYCSLRLCIFSYLNGRLLDGDGVGYGGRVLVRGDNGVRTVGHVCTVTAAAFGFWLEIDHG